MTLTKTLSKTLTKALANRSPNRTTSLTPFSSDGAVTVTGHVNGVTSTMTALPKPAPRVGDRPITNVPDDIDVIIVTDLDALALADLDIFIIPRAHPYGEVQ